MANSIAPKAKKMRPYATAPTGWGREGEFDFLHGMKGSNRTATTLDYVRTNHQLNQHTVIPKGFQKKIETDFGGNAEFITHQNIGDTSMRNFLYNLENQYRGHALDTTRLTNKSVMTKEIMRDYLEKDLFGLTPPPTDDIRCWEQTIAPSVTVQSGTTPVTPQTGPYQHTRLRDPGLQSTEGQPVEESEETRKEGTEDQSEDQPQTASELAAATVQIPTPYTPSNLVRTDAVFRPTVFLRDLQLLQKKLYMYLRGSITLYMDDTCKRMYSTWIKRLEKEKNLSESDRFDLDQRI